MLIEIHASKGRRQDSYLIDYWSYDWGMFIEKNNMDFLDYDGCPEYFITETLPELYEDLEVRCIGMRKSEIEEAKIAYKLAVGREYDASDWILVCDILGYLETSTNYDLNDLFSVLMNNEYIYDWADLEHEYEEYYAETVPQ